MDDKFPTPVHILTKLTQKFDLQSNLCRGATYSAHLSSQPSGTDLAQSVVGIACIL